MRKKSMLFAAPAFIIYTALLIIPILVAFFLSFTNWNGIASSSIKFVGINNFINLFKDARLLNAIKVTFTIAITVTIVVNILGLVFAILLNKAGKLTNIFRSIFFMPYVLSTVAVSFIWISILSYTGALNSILGAVGLASLQQDYIGNAKNAIRSICIIEIWKTVGFNMVIYLASLQTIPSELYEACTIDGGSIWDKFKNVTFPMIIPGITISVLMSIITEMRQFDLVKVITDGGPGNSTETIAYNIITQAFGNNMLGYSSAIALILFIITGTISILQINLSRRMEVES